MDKPKEIKQKRKSIRCMFGIHNYEIENTYNGMAWYTDEVCTRCGKVK